MYLPPSFLALIIGFLMIWTCGALTRSLDYKQVGDKKGKPSLSQVSLDEDAASGLDVQALIGLAQISKNADDFESRLNQKDGVNNLDLNADGLVDYIKVTEYGAEGQTNVSATQKKKKGTYGFSLTTEVLPGEIQEVANIEIEQAGKNVEVYARGNPNIYGNGHGYNSSFPLSTMLLWSYFLTPHPFYVSPWGYGYYPNRYSPYGIRNRQSYRTSADVYKKRAGAQKSTSDVFSKKRGLKNPNNGKVANNGIRRSIKNPTTTQKSFQSKLKSNRSSSSTKSGGFGRNSNKSSSFRTMRSSSYSRSSGGFGK